MVLHAAGPSMEAAKAAAGAEKGDIDIYLNQYESEGYP